MNASHETVSQTSSAFRCLLQHLSSFPAVLHGGTSFIRKVFPEFSKINRAILKKELLFRKYMLE